MKIIFIDIRKSDEVYSRHLDQSQEYARKNIEENYCAINYFRSIWFHGSF